MTIEDEIRSIRRSWNEVKGIAGDCNAWKLFMDGVKGFDDDDETQYLGNQLFIPRSDTQELCVLHTHSAFIHFV